MTPELEKQILVAGVGNAWLQDDAFGAEVARRLSERELPSGVSVIHSGCPPTCTWPMGLRSGSEYAYIVL